MWLLLIHDSGEEELGTRSDSVCLHEEGGEGEGGGEEGREGREGSREDKLAAPARWRRLKFVSEGGKAKLKKKALNNAHIDHHKDL